MQVASAEIKIGLLQESVSRVESTYDNAMCRWYFYDDKNKLCLAPLDGLRLFFNVQVAMSAFTFAAKKCRESIAQSNNLEQKNRYDLIIKNLSDRIISIANERFNAAFIIPREHLTKSNGLEVKFYQILHRVHKYTERYLAEIDDQIVVWP